MDKVIFKTNNSSLWQCAGFQPDFIGLEPDAARYLVECGIKLVGADYLSIQAVTAPDNSVHNILLTNDVLILEGPNLTGIEEDDFMLFCCPLCILGAEASPVRATLIPLTEL